MNDEHKAALREYENLKLTIKEAEARLDELKPILIPIIPEGKVIETQYGCFTLKAKSKWKYSASTEATEKVLKETKKIEEANGIAKEIPGQPFIEYRSKKE